MFFLEHNFQAVDVNKSQSAVSYLALHICLETQIGSS